MDQLYNVKPKNLYELDLKTLREEFDAGDIFMLEYIEKYLSDDLENLFIDVMNYNEIYANGWTINELIEMGKKDEYWTKRAYNFIKKYNVPKKDYDNYGDYFEKYLVLRDTLLDKLGITRYLDENIPIDDISQKVFYEEELITSLKDIEKENSYTIARVRNFGHCVELHYYPDGTAEVEYGYRYKHDYWESEVEEAKWFDKNMDEKEMFIKLWKLFIEYFEYEYTENGNFDKFCEKINNSFKTSTIKNYATLENICKDNKINVNDFLYMQGCSNYSEYENSLDSILNTEKDLNNEL